MIGLSEILIVVLGFGIPVCYLFIVRMFIRMADQETAEADRAERLLMTA